MPIERIRASSSRKSEPASKPLIKPQSATWISPKRAAEMLDVSEATIWRWTKTVSGFPCPVKLSPGCTRFSVAQLEEFIKNAGDRS